MANIPSLGKTYFSNPMNPLHALDTFDIEGNLNMLVEIPQGTFNKYEFVTEAGIIKLDRVLYEMLPYPTEYGLIPKTYDDDNDLLDVMCLLTYPTFPGCLIATRPIGIMYMNDGGERDDKILAVPADDFRFKHYKDLDDVAQIRLDEIQFFWENYKTLQFKHKNTPERRVIVERWGDAIEAREVIEKCRRTYHENFTD